MSASSAPRCTPSASTLRASAASSLTMNSAARARQSARARAPARAAARRSASCCGTGSPRRRRRSPRRPSRVRRAVSAMSGVTAYRPREPRDARPTRRGASVRAAASVRRAFAASAAASRRRDSRVVLSRAQNRRSGRILAHAGAIRLLERVPRVVLRFAHRLRQRRGRWRASPRSPRPACSPSRGSCPAGAARCRCARRRSSPYSVLTTCGVVSCVPVISTYSHPVSISRAAHSCERRLVVVLDVGEPARFQAVGREDRRLRQQQLAHRVRHLVAGELVAATRGQHRIEDQRHVRIVGDDLGDRRDVLDAAEHADLERVDRHVLEQRSAPGRRPSRSRSPAGPRRRRVLHGDRRDHRQRMAAHAGERQDVGLQAGAARRIGCGEREHDGRKFGIVVGGHDDATPGCVAGGGRLLHSRILAPCVASDPAFRRVRRSREPNRIAMKKYMCLICGFIYDEAVGAPDEGIPAGHPLGRRAAELDVSRMRRAQGRLRDDRVLACQPTFRSAEPDSMRILHTMLRVGDLERSIAFYTTVLGMRLLRRTERPEQTLHAGIRRLRRRARRRRARAHVQPWRRPLRHGTAYGHIAIEVPDATAVCDSVRAASATHGGAVTRDAGPVKGGTTVIAFVRIPTVTRSN